MKSGMSALVCAAVSLAFGVGLAIGLNADRPSCNCVAAPVCNYPETPDSSACDCQPEACGCCEKPATGS